MRRFVILLVLLLILIGTQPMSAQSSTPLVGSVVLSVENPMSHIRAGWRAPILVQAGTFISVDDLVFPDNTTLLVLCPDGSLQDFLPGQLLPNDKINCAVPRERWILNIDGVRRLNVQRGGTQDSTIPYLIAPRATLVRSPGFYLRWNALPDALEYRIRIFGDGETIPPSMVYVPQDVTNGDIASVPFPVPLQSGVAYSVEICVTLQNLQRGCTTDAGWSSGANLSFYYEPEPQLGGVPLRDLEAAIVTQLGVETPEALYARAVLLSQRSAHSSGYYMEAIDLLETLIDRHPNSLLAQSPDVYLRLGNLYREIDLPISAARAFQRATQLGGAAQGNPLCSEAIGQAYLGLGLTHPNPDLVAGFFNQALENEQCRLSDEPFAAQYDQICTLIGDICNDIRPLDEFGGGS